MFLLKNFMDNKAKQHIIALNDEMNNPAKYVVTWMKLLANLLNYQLYHMGDKKFL